MVLREKYCSKFKSFRINTKAQGTEAAVFIAQFAVQAFVGF